VGDDECNGFDALADHRLGIRLANLGRYETRQAVWPLRLAFRGSQSQPEAALVFDERLRKPGQNGAPVRAHKTNGSCNGAPVAGAFWDKQAIELASP
jgi:hypothetical protein